MEKNGTNNSNAEESIHTNKNKESFLLNTKAGFVISNHRFQFEIGQSYISREIKNGRDHTWSFVGFQFAL